MPNANTTLFDCAQESGVSLATHLVTRQAQHRGVRPWPFWPAAQHVPGDTTTAPAPGAVWIGSGDA